VNRAECPSGTTVIFMITRVLSVPLCDKAPFVAPLTVMWSAVNVDGSTSKVRNNPLDSTDPDVPLVCSILSIVTG